MTERFANPDRPTAIELASRGGSGDKTYLVVPGAVVQPVDLLRKVRPQRERFECGRPDRMGKIALESLDSTRIDADELRDI